MTTTIDAVEIPSLIFTEQGSTPATPSSGDQRLFIRTSDHVLCYVDSTGTVTPVSTPSLGNWKTPYTNGSGVLTALALGAAGTFLQSNGASSIPTFVVPALSNAQAPLTTDQTLSSANTLTDLAGCSLSLVAGTWLVIASARYILGTSATYCLTTIADGSNTDYAEADVSGVVGDVRPVTIAAIVSPGSTTTYKLRGQSGGTATVVKKQADNAGQVSTQILAVRIG